MIDVVQVVFSNPRTPFAAPNETPIALFEDVQYPGLILRYTTMDGAGTMDAYTVSGGFIRADAARSIQSDANGNPIAITACQRYFPAPIYGPCEIEIGKLYWNSTTGLWGWCQGDCYPSLPGNGPTFTHDVAIHSDGIYLWVDENFYYGSILVYSKGFRYLVGSCRLDCWTDLLTGKMYTSYSS